MERFRNGGAPVLRAIRNADREIARDYKQKGMPMPVKMIRRDENWAEIYLGDESGQSSLSTDDIATLDGLLADLAADPPALVHVRQLAANFCTGREAGKPADHTPEVYQLLARCVNRWARLPSITVATARGRCEGFGVGFLSQADLSLGGQSLVLKFPEILAGFAPTIVIGWLTKRMAWQQAARWVLTGVEIDSATAEHAGLVGEIFEDSALESEGDLLIKHLLALNGDALRECKRFALANAQIAPGLWEIPAADSLVRQRVQVAALGRSVDH
jgi:enoyl-CoA hydratase/carnithine racemase